MGELIFLVSREECAGVLYYTLLESLETINKLCILHLSSKPNKSLAPVAIVKSHRKKYQNNSFVTSSPFAEM